MRKISARLLLLMLLFLEACFHGVSVYSSSVHESAVVADMEILTATAQGPKDLPASRPQKHEIAFVDGEIQHYRQLVNDLLANHNRSRQIDVVVLDGDRDGVDQIGEMLARYPQHEIDAIQVVSHGMDGGVKLGNIWLTTDNLSAYAGRLATWKKALSASADLLIYGCKVAATERGRQFVKSVSMLTGSNVAASVDDTGSQALGGNWNLEYSEGTIDTASVVSVAGETQWSGMLGIRISGLVPAPLSNEILVNTTTAGDQWNYYWSIRTVTVAPDGSFIKVWIDLGGADGSQYGIFGQRFDSSGNKVGGEFLINTTAQNKQDNASLALAPNGNFIVVWDSQSGTGKDIFGQRFLADGTKVGGEFQVNTTVNGDQKYPEVDYAADGSFVVAWVSPQGGGGAKTVFQRFDANGNKVGGEVLLSSSNANDQILDSLDVKPDGSFLVTWTEAGDVYGRLYDASTVPVSAEFRINQYLTGTQEYSIARCDALGNFVVVWESDGQDGSGMGIYGRRYAANGTPLGNEFALTSQTAGAQFEPQLAVDGAGNFVVAWSDGNALDGSAESVWMRRFDFNGTALGSSVQVNQTTSGYQAYPVIAMNDTGRIVVPWEGNGPGDSYGVFVRIYQAGQFVTEGATTTFTAVLDTAPTAPVTLNLTISDTSEISLNTTSLTFDSTNWNVPQTVTITGLQDWIIDGTVGVTIVTSPLVSADPAYNGLNPDDIPVVVADSGVGPYSISGAVFEDVNYGGGAGRSKAASSGVGRSGARLELYNSAGSYVTFTTTDASGNYSFTGLTSATFTVRVVSSTVTSSQTGYVAGLLPVQTFRTNATSGTAVAVTDYVGGQNPAVADAGNGGAGTVMNTTTGVFTAGITGTAQSITTATYAAGNISGLDFGFNFDTIVNTNNSGQGSLRQFITNANTLNGDAILAQSGLVAGKENAVFMISNGTNAAGLRSSNNYLSGGVATISPTSALPTISTVMVIDAQKQPGWTSAPIIELNGAGAGSGAKGLELTGGSTVVRGFVINRFTGSSSSAGIWMSTAGSNIIQGNFIGTNSSGNAASANYQGIYVSGTSSTNIIGGSSTSQRNVISGNTWRGVQTDNGSSGNIIRGNYIGTNAAGDASLANNIGIYLLQSANNTVGGTGAGEGNVLSGNTNFGLYLVYPEATGNVVQGNTIGLNAARSGSVPNGSSGIDICCSAGGGAVNNTIGGTAVGATNVISGNTGRGIRILAGTGNAVLSNSIYGNGGIGIDLGNDGVTFNDGVKTSGQPNLLTDYPVFTSASISGSTLTVSGYVGSAPNQGAFANARVEIFQSDNDSSGYGEGQLYLGYLTTDANGNFSGSLSVIGVAPGYRITGTATDGNNNTSEFGPNFTVTTGGGLCPGFTVTTTTDGAAGSLRECITAANATSGATIVVPAGTYTLTVAGQSEDNNATGDLDIRSSMTITGEGAKVTTIDGNNIDRVLDLQSVQSLTVTISGLTIRNGRLIADDGGALNNYDNTVTLNDIAITGCTAVFGGAVFNDGVSASLTLNRVTISGNSTASNGGGVFGMRGSITVINSTISGNTANGASSEGGAVYVDGAIITATNSTIAGNSATVGGGGIRRNSGTITLKNTIVSSNTGGNCSGTITSAGYNIDSANTCALSGTGDKPNTNPNLGALADNGGPTQTHALQAGSPAIDAGTATGTPTTDQRGVARPQSSGYDIGAYEYAMPTAVKLISFTATEYGGAVHLQWKTGYEVDNLGFHVYREQDGQLYLLTPELIAGSALLAGKGTALTAGHHYAWWDTSVAGTNASGMNYWLEDIDLDGTRTLHGPVSPVVSRESLPEGIRPEFLADFGMKIQDRYREHAKLKDFRDKLGKGSRKQTGASSHLSQSIKAPQASSLSETITAQPSEQDRAMQWSLASAQAVKIFIDQEGWYRISQSELVSAGLSRSANARYLQLYAEGREQPIRVIGNRNGTSFDAIEFYGTGLDTPSTGTRVYWLIAGSKQGLRLDSSKSQGGKPEALNFPSSVEKKDRIIYFAALKNGDKENFFGPVIGPAGVDQLISVPHPDNSPGDAQLELTLQGVTTVPHRVKVLLNDEEVGEVVFEGQASITAKTTIPQEALLEGDNLVSLVAQNGETDISLIAQIRLTYWRTYTAEDDTLKCTAQGGLQITLKSFSDPDIRVMDVTSSTDMYEITGAVQPNDTGYSVTFKVPGSGSRTLLALTGGKVKKPLTIKANNPSSWYKSTNGADLLIISHSDFLKALEPLRSLRQSQGLSVSVVDVEDLYDEFSFGVKSPQAIKDFLSLTQKQWSRKPRYVLLAGGSSVDPRNYLGFGDRDFVPTRLIDTQYLETASDDWYTDFNADGLPDMAIGRLPVRTVQEAEAVVSKITGYERTVPTREALFVADSTEGFDFEAATREVEAQLPINVGVREVFRGSFQSDEQARDEVLSAIDQGPVLVNYVGHGSVGLWRGSILTSDDTDSLINGMRLPFVLAMTCLNGAFHDLYSRSLASALLKAPQGGAIAVWASSGLTEPEGQNVMNRELMRLLFNGTSLTVGEAAMKAKAATTDQDIRRTWILFGDPTTRLKTK